MKVTFKVCFCCARSFKVKSSEPPQEIKTLFDNYSKNGRMSEDEMLRCVIQVQGETHADSNYVKDIFNMLKNHGVFHPRGLHLEEFYRYLLSDFNSPLPLSGEVWQDMTQPLSHYFLYTGHNSYLTGNQINSRSSTEPIVKALKRGVRVIELDLWPNSSGTEAEVRHGGTLTSTEDLQKCLNAVKENAFEVSEYPVVLTLEDHLNPDLQKKVAKMVSKTFGRTLFRCRDEYKKCFPSPEALKNKILISTKPPKEYLQTHISQGATTAESVKAEELIQDEDEKTVAVEYRDLISIHAGNRKGGLKNCLNGDPNRVIRLSMSEQWLETLAKTRGPDVVKFSQRNILRIFPKATRFDSSNNDPLVGWIHGAQMVAFNLQSHGKFLWMMQGMFKANGGCGYVKKPDVLLSNGPGGGNFNPYSQGLQIKTTLKVTFKVCFCCARSFKVKSSEPPQEIKTLFDNYSQNGRISEDEMLRFVIQVQGETHADSNYVKDMFNMLKHHGVFHPRGLHLEEFYRYLLSDFNSPLPLSGEVWQDMTQPLSHYFLYTGHNSYLTGNQLNSRSSIEPIVKALKRGVRVIELDLWPNSSGTEAEVRHGGTLTSTEDLQKCLNAVKENAFEVSDYPVVLTLEDHLNPDLQKKVAKMVSKTFGRTLFRCRGEYKKCFPSPEALKNKILISTKPPKEYLQTHISQGATTNESVNAEELIQDEDEKTVAVEYRDLISIHAGNRKGGLKNCLNGDPNRVMRLSMSEQWLETLAKTRGPDIVKFTQRNILRIFPKTTRFDSSNYDPLVGWIHGAQMVAFNMQSHGKFLWMMQGMFKANGGCGYVKKPDVLLSNGPGGGNFNPYSQDLQVKTTLKVKIYSGEGWNLDFSQDHFDRYSPPDFYARTNGFRWNEEFEFPLRVPELALLCITVKDHDKNSQNDFAGQTCLPLSEIRPGIRAVRLHDRLGDVFKHARLLVRFVFEPRVLKN
ncbi:hypothetical protein F2Q70_00007839 [Brassica cretica]|uniref:Phosphoinositide phospholipase C n=1 Tax=Brassica cretica TaxID=69181 RepID=A0A8S9M0L9_BRACR|nr:hypothetical protein F2Q70_00007839 [Brassica cretica]